MTLFEVNMAGNKIRRMSWESGQYLEIFNTQDYCGTEWAFEPKAYGPSGLLRRIGTPQFTPWWIPGDNPHKDWEILEGN